VSTPTQFSTAAGFFAMQSDTVGAVFIDLKTSFAQDAGIGSATGAQDSPEVGGIGSGLVQVGAEAGQSPRAGPEALPQALSGSFSPSFLKTFGGELHKIDLPRFESLKPNEWRPKIHHIQNLDSFKDQLRTNNERAISEEKREPERIYFAVFKGDYWRQQMQQGNFFQTDIDHYIPKPMMDTVGFDLRIFFNINFNMIGLGVRKTKLRLIQYFNLRFRDGF